MRSEGGSACGPALSLRRALPAVGALALVLAGCGGGEDEPPGPVDGVDAAAAEETVRNAFADPSLLCGELATKRYVGRLGGEEKCLTQAEAVPDGAREEGDGFVIGSAKETAEGATVAVETPDFGRYVYELVEENGSLRVDSVERPVPGTERDPG